MNKLGLIAGGGALPVSVAARCEAEGRPVFLVRLAGFADVHLARYPGIDAGLAEFGKILSALKAADCSAVCFAGTVNRPDFKTLKPDLRGAALLPGIISAATKGDDALLRKVLSVFEGEGYGIEGADDILGGETLPAGALGAVQPTGLQLSDLRKALYVAEKAGELDIGQGAVVCDGLVLAVEALSPDGVHRFRGEGRVTVSAGPIAAAALGLELGRRIQSDGGALILLPD